MARLFVGLGVIENREIDSNNEKAGTYLRPIVVCTFVC